MREWSPLHYKVYLKDGIIDVGNLEARSGPYDKIAKLDWRDYIIDGQVISLDGKTYTIVEAELQKA